MSEKFEIVNLELKSGESLKIKGQLPGDARSFSFNIGRNSSDVGLHFNPRLSENTIVCNSKRSNNWESEQRSGHMCFTPGSDVKISVKLNGDKFEVKLPDGHEITFPNRHGYDKLTYLSVKGDFKVTSFKYE
ncbi:galectin-2 [Pelobates cultripes]|uniref:Galectin n=1 Tax=Pelobates cultripes TaxID=61616 RepID=A0AAD1WLE0_PELCU|nr:galectin-2 [Pelobates cultripes]